MRILSVIEGEIVTRAIIGRTPLSVFNVSYLSNADNYIIKSFSQSSGCQSTLSLVHVQHRPIGRSTIGKCFNR